MSDRDRAQVYAAESAAFEGTSIEMVASFDSLVGVARRVTEAIWWPVPGVVIVESRGDARSSTTTWRTGQMPTIKLARPQRTLATLSHELAHVLAGSSAGHGPDFRRAHLDVTAAAIGADGAGWLADAFAAFGLPVGQRSWPEPTSGIAL